MSPFDPAKVERPAPALLKYYIIMALLTGPLSVFVILPLLFKYETLRYKFDSEGMSMSWGILMRREIYLTYRRIQDIHVNRNIVERWMGLAKVPIQTASGTSGPTMRIEGIRNPEPLRDFLYERMRGAKEEAGLLPSGESSGDQALALLTEIRDELRALRAGSAER